MPERPLLGILCMAGLLIGGEAYVASYGVLALLSGALLTVVAIVGISAVVGGTE